MDLMAQFGEFGAALMGNWAVIFREIKRLFRGKVRPDLDSFGDQSHRDYGDKLRGTF